MKNIATVLSCALLCAYGAYISTESKTQPMNTISAAEVPLHKLLNPVKVQVHDTIFTGDTIRDTVPRVITKVRYKVKREPCATCENVSLTRPTVREDRKEAPLDSITKRYKDMELRFIRVWAPFFVPKNDSTFLLGVEKSPV